MGVPLNIDWQQILLHLLNFVILAGGLYLLIMDTLARTVLMPIEIPIGVLTAMVGGPFFLYLLKRRNDA